MPSTPRPRILCVDDDKDAREMLVTLLKFSNIDASCVQSAEEGWEMIKADSFDLYLLDSWLPGADGFELCRQIRSIDGHTPILFYSAAAYDADRQKAIEAGANAYLTKPDVDDLLQTITDVLEREAKTYSPRKAEWRRNASSRQFTLGRDDEGSNKPSAVEV